MEKIIKTSVLLLICLQIINAQKLAEPKHLGNWIAGEDPSEFLLHSVLEASELLLEDNPDGKLIIRICSKDDLATAFIKTSMNPLSVSGYNQYRQIVPYEKIYIAKYAGCLGKDNFVYNQYWVVPNKSLFKYDEVISVNKIKYSNNYLEEYDHDGYKSKRKNYKLLTKKFDKMIEKFVDNLAENPNSKGFIIHNSKRKELKSNISKVIRALKEKGIKTRRYTVIKKPRLEWNEKGEIYLEKNDKMNFPRFSIIEINK